MSRFSEALYAGMVFLIATSCLASGKDSTVSSGPTTSSEVVGAAYAHGGVLSVLITNPSSSSILASYDLSEVPRSCLSGTTASATIRSLPIVSVEIPAGDTSLSRIVAGANALDAVQACGGRVAIHLGPGVPETGSISLRILSGQDSSLIQSPPFVSGRIFLRRQQIGLGAGQFIDVVADAGRYRLDGWAVECGKRSTPLKEVRLLTVAPPLESVEIRLPNLKAIQSGCQLVAPLRDQSFERINLAGTEVTTVHVMAE